MRMCIQLEIVLKPFLLVRNLLLFATPHPSQPEPSQATPSRRKNPPTAMPARPVTARSTAAAKACGRL